MNGRDILKELSFIDPGYIEAAAPLPVEKGNDGFMHKFLLIAAIAATLLLLTGAAAYTKWSSSIGSVKIPKSRLSKADCL